MQGLHGAPWSARAVVHPFPIYQVEGDPQRRGDGIYDRMRSVGAHEVLVENPRHDGHLWNAGEDEIEQLLLLTAHRIDDLKQDSRLKYVSIFKNHGLAAGQEFTHPVSELTATTFVPRRVLYKLRASREYFKQKERCVFCDIVSQEVRQNQRVLEMRGDFLAFGPYAPRVPYEMWIIPQTHEMSFERVRHGSMRDLAVLLRRTLQRIRTITEDFHLVLHTSPNTRQTTENPEYWKTIDEDYHWHIEIMPILGAKAKSYTFKEVYYSPISSETAVKRLREASIDG
jgi:UDPglucose--hexose-1-phosphate uridylyltransferase